MSIGVQMGNILIGRYTDSLGATATVVGVVSSAFAWSAILLRLVAGPVLDAFNRKYVIVAALGVTAIAFAGCALSTSVPQLIVCRLLEGVGLTFTTTAFIVMAADALPARKTATGLGFYALAAGIAQMCGPAISLTVSAAFGFAAAFWIAAAFVAVAAIAALRIRLAYRPVRRIRLRISSVIAPEVLMPAGIMVLVFACYSLIDPFLPIYAHGLGIGAQISLFFTVYAVVLMGARPLAGWCADRFGYVVLVPMLSLFFLALWVISVSTDLWMFLAAAALFALGYGGCQPVLQSLAMRLVPLSRRGAAGSTNFIGSDLGKIIGPIIGGSIADAVGFSAMWQVMSVTILIAVVVVLIGRRGLDRNVAKAEIAS